MKLHLSLENRVVYVYTNCTEYLSIKYVMSANARQNAVWAWICYIQSGCCYWGSERGEGVALTPSIFVASAFGGEQTYICISAYKDF